jgi:hypothetical protein
MENIAPRFPHRIRVSLSLTVLVCSLLPAAAKAQFTQQGPKLVGTGAVNGYKGASQGGSVSLSGDGNTAIVGGRLDNDGAGAAWVYGQPATFFAGTPGKANCFGQTVTILQAEFGGLNGAATALELPTVRALQNAILAFCQG